jgi:hypothetical protein
VKRLLDGDHACCVAGEHLGSGSVWCAAGDRCQRFCVSRQVQCVLHDMEREGVMRKAAVGQPGDKRVGQDGAVDIGDALPQLAGEAVIALLSGA